jgi:superfamily II DNA or RNA helicase
MILGPTPAWMMDNGFIARPRYLPHDLGQQMDIRGLRTDRELAAAVDAKPAMVGDTVKHYQLHGNGLPFLGSAINISQAERFATAWNEAGIPCAVIHSGLPDREQDRLFAALKSKEIRGLWSVDMMGRGVDVPSVKYLVCCRPTHSLAWWLQWLGRAIRIDGDIRPIIADHVGNLFRHGTVEMEREWSLDGVSRKKREKEVLTSVRQCVKCFVMFAAGPSCCPSCGHVPEINERTLKERKGTLKELSAKEIEEQARLAKARKAKASLIRQGFARKVRNPFQFAAREAAARKLKEAQIISQREAANDFKALKRSELW